jgi:trk system potassium uptake protein TrkA
MDLHMPAGSVIGLLERGRELLIPTGKTELMAGDKIVIFASADIMPLAMETIGESVK